MFYINLGGYMERRLINRKTFDQPLKLDVSLKERIPGKNWENSLATDISFDGLGLSTDYELKKGDVVKIRIPVQTVDVDIPVYAIVVWSKPEKSNFRAGLLFLA
jgi:hypothetical protein